MHFFFIIFLTLFSYQALALNFPEVGNYARYEAILHGKKYEMKKALIDYNSDQDSFTQASKMTTGDQVLEDSVYQIGRQWFYTPEKVESVLKNCLRREGAPEKIEISGVLISACTFHNMDAQLDYTIGMVPFGQLRFQLYLGRSEFLDFHLVEFN